jgi:integrase
MLDKNYIRRRLVADLRALDLRHRRGHDLRRTFQPLADEDGIECSLHRLVTHAPSQDVLDLYTTVQWARLCEAVARLRVERRKSADILALPTAAWYSAVVQR